jgi:hypothetical protein
MDLLVPSGSMQRGCGKSNTCLTNCHQNKVNSNQYRLFRQSMLISAYDVIDHARTYTAA